MRARRRQADLVRREVLEFCAVLAGELRAGRTQLEALAWAARSGYGEPEDIDRGTAGTAPASGGGGLSGALGSRLVKVARLGGSVPGVLMEAARTTEGGDGLARVAACWQVAEAKGTGLAVALDRVCSGLRAEQAQRLEVTAQLAGARSTVQLLAALPVFGLLLGTGLGGAPLDVLLHTPHGLTCLAAGLTLEVLGLIWSDRIAADAERAA